MKPLFVSGGKRKPWKKWNRLVSHVKKSWSFRENKSWKRKKWLSLDIFHQWNTFSPEIFKKNSLDILHFSEYISGEIFTLEMKEFLPPKTCLALFQTIKEQNNVFHTLKKFWLSFYRQHNGRNVLVNKNLFQKLLFVFSYNIHSRSWSILKDSGRSRWHIVQPKYSTPYYSFQAP